MTYAAPNPQAVESADEVTAEFQAGHADAVAYYASGRRSRIASMTAAELEAWDGSEEKALVSDPDGTDLPDDAEQDQAA